MRLKKPSRTILILAGLGFALSCMLAPSVWAYVSLQQVYDNAGSGGGYDKLLELDPQEEYGGDLYITSGVTVCIQGNGAKIIGLSSPTRAIRVYGSKLDIDHCILVGRNTGQDGIYYDSNSYGKAANNTITSFKNSGITTYYIQASSGMVIENNIITDCYYGYYGIEDYMPTYFAYNCVSGNHSLNRAYYCPG
jgi:hypothetical protein